MRTKPSDGLEPSTPPSRVVSTGDVHFGLASFVQGVVQFNDERSRKMSLQQNSAAVAAARAHVEAWGKRDYESARSALAEDVWVTAIASDPTFPKTDLHGADAYMQGLIQFADGVVPGST